MKFRTHLVPSLLRTLKVHQFGRRLFLFPALVMLTGCGRSPNMGGAGGPPGGAMPPTEVGVVTVTPEAVTVTTELPGRINAVREAEVRARATGILLKRRFEEGADVTADQVLFEIDPAPLQASYDSAKASLAKAEATQEQAQAKAKRNEALVKINGVSQQAYEDARASALQSEADVLAAKAALETAALNLGYTKVTAPFSGRIGKALITEGALASASEATKMAVIRQLDPIYVDFTQSSAELLKLRRSLEPGKLPGVSKEEVRIALLLEDGTTYAETGRLVFQDVSVDANTGAVLLRAEFPNAEKLLLPGMYVRARLAVVQPKAITVPQRAVSRDVNGQASVWLVNAQNVAEARAIQATAISGDKWIVSSGLNAGDRVIVEGLQKVRAGAPVAPVPFQAGNSNAPLKSSAATANP
ncbi:MAG: efflux RND transporter periplasmic adaptor subunit [Verrucomicrobiae bacterium]|nr:efflux RND transporter periplasmic adaptor subunit [Verrucomicrobiae bacterium]